jgi:DHA2 family multidrug resistance protein
MRNLGGAIGIAVCATILNDRTNEHFYHLAERLNASNEAMNGWLATTSGHLAELGQNANDASDGSLHQLWLLAYREAQTLSYADAFLVIGLCFVVATAMVPLMRKVAPPAAPSADAH